MAELESSWQSAGWMDELPGSSEPASPPPPPPAPAPSLAAKVKAVVVRAEKRVEKAVTSATKAVKKAVKKAPKKKAARKVVRKKEAGREARRAPGGAEDRQEERREEAGCAPGRAAGQAQGQAGKKGREEGGEEVRKEGGKEVRQEAPLILSRPFPDAPPRLRRGVVYFEQSRLRRGLMTRAPAVRAGFALAAVLALAACERTAPDGVALVGATVFDGTSSQALHDQVIIVRNDRIEAIGTRQEVDIPRRMRTVDLSGKFVVPGLIDGHVHVQRWTLPRFLAAGVTTVRDVHGPFDSIMALREQANLGALTSPRIFSAGAMIDAAPPTYSDAFVVSGNNDARKAVDKLAVIGRGLRQDLHPDHARPDARRSSTRPRPSASGSPLTLA